MTRAPARELGSATEMRNVTAGAACGAAILAIGSGWFAVVTWTFGAIALSEVLISARLPRDSKFSKGPSSASWIGLNVAILAGGGVGDFLLSGLTSCASLVLASGVVIATILPESTPGWRGGEP